MVVWGERFSFSRVGELYILKTLKELIHAMYLLSH